MVEEGVARAGLRRFGGAVQNVREVIAVATLFLPRDEVVTQVEYMEV